MIFMISFVILQFLFSFPAVEIEFTNPPKLEISLQQLLLKDCKYKFNAALLSGSNTGSFSNAVFYEVSNSSGIFRLTDLIQPTPTPSTPPVTTTTSGGAFARKRRVAEGEISVSIPEVVLTSVFQREAKYRCVVFDKKYMIGQANSQWVDGNTAGK